MPDVQTLLDRGLSVAEIRRMCSNFRALPPRQRVGVTPVGLLKAPILDACNHG